MLPSYSDYNGVKDESGKFIEELGQCGICIEKLEPRKRIVVHPASTKSGQSCHIPALCIKAWLEEFGTCPLCQVKLERNLPLNWKERFTLLKSKAENVLEEAYAGAKASSKIALIATGLAVLTHTIYGGSKIKEVIYGEALVGIAGIVGGILQQPIEANENNIDVNPRDMYLLRSISILVTAAFIVNPILLISNILEDRVSVISTVVINILATAGMARVVAKGRLASAGAAIGVIAWPLILQNKISSFCSLMSVTLISPMIGGAMSHILEKSLERNGYEFLNYW